LLLVGVVGDVSEGARWPAPARDVVEGFRLRPRGNRTASKVTLTAAERVEGES
jgi:hypothetical protein